MNANKTKKSTIFYADRALLVACLLVPGIASTSVLDGVYLGAGAGLGYLKPKTTGTEFSVADEKDTGGHVLLGKDFSAKFSGELGYTDLGAAQLSPNGEIDYSILSLSGLYYGWASGGAGRRDGLSLYGRAGLGKLDNESQQPFRRVNDMHVLIGAGVEYNTRGGFGARAEIISYDKDARFANLSLIYRLGEKSKSDLPEIVVSSPLQKSEKSESIETTPTVTDWSTQDMPIVYFDTNSTDLEDTFLFELEALSRRMTNEPDLYLTLVGHTDSRGSKKYNAQLAKKRVVSVARFMAQRSVDVSRIRAYSKGEENAIAGDSAHTAYDSDRRVEIYARQN